MTAADQPPARHQPALAGRPRAGAWGRRIRRSCTGDEGERGTLTLYMLPIMGVLLLGAGLVFDGGTLLIARGRAADLAAQAARAGADALDPASLRAGGPVAPRVDPAAARVAGQRILAAAGATGTITVHGRDVVSVTARVPAHPSILSIIGVDDLSGTATASATILHGVATPRGGP